MLVDEFRAMNSQILVAAEGKAPRVKTGFQEVRRWIDESEGRFTRFSDQSELAALNRSAGNWFQASPDFYEVVWLAKGLWEQTSGLFNPAILPALRQAGYDRSMDELRLQEDAAPQEPGARLRVRQDFGDVRFDEASQGIWIPLGMQIDLGGIAKGWIAEQAALRLSNYAESCGVSAGGDMFLIGYPEGLPTWRVQLEDPRDPTRDLATIHSGPGAIATSSVSKRRWMQAGKERHHLIDPRSGEPARTSWLSVTVSAPHAAQAEVFAKSALIAGPGGFYDLPWNEAMGCWTVGPDGLVWGINNKNSWIEVNDGSIEYQ